jgi:hypothetical protein
LIIGSDRLVSLPEVNWDEKADLLLNTARGDLFEVGFEGRFGFLLAEDSCENESASLISAGEVSRDFPEAI